METSEINWQAYEEGQKDSSNMVSKDYYINVWIPQRMIPGSIVYHHYRLYFEWRIGNFCWIHKKNCSLERFKPTGGLTQAI